ncbi:sensor histidine kinase [Sedimenticola selenatireducens]|uniref:histidine kinase n=1 Tax=Sedimenticola selenatireducens TaxID=191960 RepID=A0A2N6CS75_9GAMM|nr:ATP-binding protein [Sedimenticola selenatireducens]PLX59931.1 MAG: two-component sensor histidine kinase [Sedimenticola selenatireducens]
MRSVQYLLMRSVWLLSGVALLLLFVSQGLLIYSAWDYAARIKPIQQHMDYLRMLEVADFDIRTKLVNLLDSESGFLDPDETARQTEQLRDLIIFRTSLAKPTSDALNYALTQLEAFDGRDQVALRKSMSAMRSALNQELNAHQSLISSFYMNAERKQRFAIGLAFGFLIISVMLWAMVRQRIVLPLSKLTDQMMLLTRRDYSELEVEDADPMLSGIIEKYNHMAKRLKILESAQQQREDTLATEVRNTSYLLLQQQYRLSQAERLGAVGEMAAGIAHELRNPLTGVQMALDNIRGDMPDEDLAERIDLVASEVRRVNQQLNHLLDQTRQRPELPTSVNIHEDLKSLISLVKFQLSREITLVHEVDKQLTCQLPRNRFRQALLNLILNAGQALNETPGKITVRVVEKGDLLEVKVMDSGPGFSASMLNTGIQPFHTGRSDGTGLGLVMVRRTISDFGGEVHLSNQEEGGACVTLTMPCNKNG